MRECARATEISNEGVLEPQRVSGGERVLEPNRE